MTNADFNFRDNSGQIIVGSDNNVHFFKYEITPQGGVVNILPPEQAPRITARQTPIRLRPRAFSDLHGREIELEQSVTALKASQAVELYGLAGIGKSVLLRQLAHHATAESLQYFPDGVVYFHQLRDEPVEDLQQRLFEAFYESDRPFKPSAVRVQHDLQNKRALILLDNAKLSRRDIEKLGEIAPNCVFAFTSLERSLWGEGQPIQVGGLSSRAALDLIQRKLQRSLTPQEQAAAEAICTSLNGHPLEILQQIAGVCEGKEWLADVAGRVQKSASQKGRVEQLLKPLDRQKRSVLAALAALGGIAISAKQALAIADEGTESDLGTLKEMHLVQQEDSRYSLSANLLDSVKQIENLTPYMERAVFFVAKWAQHTTPEKLQQESEAVSHLLQWAVKQGRWNDVLLLGKPFESALALSGQWELQAQVLQWYQKAAENAGDKSALAWAAHEMGIYSFCLGETSRAWNLLNKAFKLREELGDIHGAEFSQQHLNLQALSNAPIPVPPVPSPSFWTDLFQKALMPTLMTGGLIGVSVLASKIIPFPSTSPVLTPSKTPNSSSPDPSPTSIPTEAVTPKRASTPQPSPDPKESVPSTSQMTAEDFFKRGLDRYFNKSDVSGAIKDYNQAIALKNDYAEAYHRRGFAYYYGLDIVQKALEDLDQAIELKDDYVDAYMDRAVIRSKLNNFEGAIDDFTKVTRIDSKNTEAFSLRGIIYCTKLTSSRRKEDYQAAIHDFNRAIEINPDYADAYLNRGICVMTLADKQRGLVDMQRAADLYQKQGEAETAQVILDLIMRSR